MLFLKRGPKDVCRHQNFTLQSSARMNQQPKLGFKRCHIYHLNQIKFNFEFWFHWTCQKIPSQLLLGLPPCVSCLLLCNKPPQHLQAYNNNHCLSHEPAIWTKLSRDSLCLLHLMSSWAVWLGLEDLFARWLTSLAALLVSAAAGSWVVCGLEVSVPLHVGFSMSHLAFFTAWHWVPDQAAQGARQKLYQLLWLILGSHKVPFCFCHKIQQEESYHGNHLWKIQSATPLTEKLDESSRVFKKPNILASSLQTLAR